MTTRSIIPSIGVVPSLNRDSSDSTTDITFGISPMFDHELGDFMVSGGSIDTVSGRDNLRMWITKTLATHVDHYIVYNEYYGSLVNNMIARLSNEVMEVMVPEFVKSALLGDDRITEVVNFQVTIEEDKMYVSFQVVTFEFDRLNVERIWSIN